MTTELDIKIRGREYRVSCAPGEIESLQAAAQRLIELMDSIAKATKSTGERLAVMTALNLAHELNIARQQLAATSAGGGNTPPATAPSEKSIDPEGVVGRIKDIEAQLDELLEPQDKLL